MGQIGVQQATFPQLEPICQKNIVMGAIYATIKLVSS